MSDQDIRFGCVGCGTCCTGRYIPLTLDEAKLWLERGDQVGVLVEAFNTITWETGQAALEHSLARSATVTCGSGDVQAIAIFAGKAIPRCPNLKDDGMCNIYEVRPLVCRIYPMEINPFIKLNPLSKDCPPPAWEGGEVLVSDRVMEPVMSRNIESSRAADRSDALAKIAVCESLGLTTAAWKSKGLAIYEPSVIELLGAIRHVQNGNHELSTSWTITTTDEPLMTALASNGMAVTSDTSGFTLHQF
jgi:Fe-S-cluster containining protein